jgi:hypothetical protein
MQDTFMKQHATFGNIISILLILNLIGCTSLQTIEAPPDKLHEQIRNENLVKVGDKVRVITEDKKEHQFVVTAINEDEIRGEDVTIPIDSIVTVETRKVSAGKTALLAGGITGTVLVVFALLLMSVGAFMVGA